MYLIETVGLSQVYEGREVLKGVSLGIARSEVFALIGPTGSGKTTLMRILDLLETPTSGRILFDGVDVSDHGFGRLGARRRMSYVQQRPLLFSMNVYENVARGLRWRHFKPASVKRKSEEALELVGMTAYRRRNAKTLSGGEMQRVAIARALVTEPEILFLDEPTANMDPVSTAMIEEALAHIIKERKTTIVMATHNMSQGQRMAVRLGVLMDGVLEQTGSVSDIFSLPANRRVAEFVGVENIISGVVVDKDAELIRVDAGGQSIFAVSPLAVGDKVHVLIRPEDIVFSLAGQAGSARNVFLGRVTRINTVGALVRLEVECGIRLLGVVTTQAAQELNISMGKELFASFKATAIHVVKRWDS